MFRYISFFYLIIYFCAFDVMRVPMCLKVNVLRILPQYIKMDCLNLFDANFTDHYTNRIILYLQFRIEYFYLKSICKLTDQY